MGGKRSALIVASYDYQDPGLRLLRAPVRDAEALAAVLQDPDIGDFHVQTMLNEPAHVVALGVNDFFADRDRDDLLVIHFSCHGVKDETGELYFATTDTKLRRLAATAVSADFVNRLMGRSRSRRIVLLLDCCYAGAFERGMVTKADKAVHIEDQFGGRGRAVITASGAMEYAFEEAELADSSELRPSVFTRALVEGLDTGDADRDQDGYVGLDELYDYVFDRVQEVTPNQTPGKWTFAIEGELQIARRRGPVTKPAPLPPELQQAIEQPLAGIRLGAVHELERLLRARHAGLALAARLGLEGLREDDSRAVAEAATAALDAHSQMPARQGDTPAARVAISASEIDFGRLLVHSQPPSRTIQVRNTAEGSLDARVARTPEWVRAELAGDELTLSVDPAVVGSLTGDVVVETRGGPATVRVTARVDPRPPLVVKPRELDFGRLVIGAAWQPRRIELRAAGGHLAWEFSTSGEFFEVEREPTALLVRLRPVPGRHSGTILIRSNGGDATIHIKADIASPPPQQWPPVSPDNRERRRRPVARVFLIAFLALAVFTTAVVALKVALPSSPVVPSDTRSGGTEPIELSPVGDAVKVGDKLRLTASRQRQIGAAWSTVRRNVQQPFTVTFRFQNSEPRSGPPDNLGGDGIAFVIQNHSGSSLGHRRSGAAGGGIGYQGIPNSLAVEFDTSQNLPKTSPILTADPDGHHISVHTRGEDPNSADETYRIGRPQSAPSLKDGLPHTARIKSAAQRLNIYLDDLDHPVLTVQIDLSTTLRLTNSEAWIGFTSATGQFTERHDIWSVTWSST
jgi:Bacterial lectin/Caspase domain